MTLPILFALVYFLLIFRQIMAWKDIGSGAFHVFLDIKVQYEFMCDFFIYHEIHLGCSSNHILIT